MGKEKGGFLTPKAIANRIKAKGLQKLKWYCQMCQKQCRDENGFKCHLSSESHQRQLLLFAENPDQYIDTFSKEFLDDFIELLSHRFGTKRVLANTVYQEYVANRHHVHMNSTQWPTLTDFVKWLGRNSYAVVDETERGWYCAYIDKKPEAIEKQKSHEKKEKMAVNDEERTLRLVERQRERDLDGGKAAAEPEYTQLIRDDSSEEKVAFSLGSNKQDDQKRLPAAAANPLAAIASSDKESNGALAKEKPTASKRKTALEEIMEADAKMKEKRNRKDYWLTEGIVVKLTSKSVGEKYYKKKGIIKDVLDKYTAVIQMVDSKDVLKVDQDHVETVLPALGRQVLVVNGAYRGAKATLVSLNESAFSCTISITSGVHLGRTVSGVQYEDICKLHVPDE